MIVMDPTIRRSHLLAIGAAVLLLFHPIAGRSDEPAVEVADFAWTSEVRDLQITDHYDNRSSIPLHPLCFWNRLVASRTALDELRAHGRLPIRHRWIHYFGTVPELEDVTPTDEIALDVGVPQLIDKLEREVSNRGWFDWRTWSRKENMRRGMWRLDILYNDDQPVMCKSETSAQVTPCQFFITVH